MTGTAPRSRITWTKASASYPLSAITYSVGAEGGSALACRELELERVAQSVDAHVNFAAEATPASAQTLRPLAPAFERRAGRTGMGLDHGAVQ